MKQSSILVVEDEGIIAKDLEYTLQTLGFLVPAVASTGEEAIEKSEQITPDLVLMDIVLDGELDGVHAARAIRDRFNIPVVFLTAFSNRGIVERAKIAEPYGYIIKPFDERELHVAIEMALHKHRMEQKPRGRERWLEIALRSIGDGVVAAGGDERVIFMNRVAEELTGWKQDQALGVPAADVLRAGDDGAQNAGGEKDGARRGSRTLLSKAGTRIPIEESRTTITDDAGKLIGSVWVVRDLTGNRRIEEERDRANRLESLGVLTGGIAHDLNHFLMAVLDNIVLTRADQSLNGALSRQLTNAEYACLRARDLTKRLVTFLDLTERLVTFLR